MTATRRPTPDQRRRSPAAPLRALASLLALVAVLAAMPTVLYLATRTLSSRFPDRDDLTFDALLERPADAGVAYVVVLAVGWLAWVMVAGALLWEIPAALRGRTRRAVRGFRWSQRLAAFLLGGLALTVSAGPALASHAAPVAAVSAPTGVDSGGPAAPVVARAGAVAAEGPTYTVQRGDTLWDIAERTLGDGARWQEIASLNDGRVMTDGHTFRAADDIDVGWILRMPAGARTTAPPAAGGTTPDPVAPARAPAEDAPRTVTVRAGDTLSDIAHRELGDADWAPLFEANKGRAQADGGSLSDPDVIETGWVLVLPAGPDTRIAPTPDAPGARTDADAPPAVPPAPPASDPGATPDKPTAPAVPDTATAPDGAPAGQDAGGGAPAGRTPPGRTSTDQVPTGQAPPAQTPAGRVPTGQAPTSQPPTAEQPPPAQASAPPVQDPTGRRPAPDDTAQAPPAPPRAEAPATRPPAADTPTAPTAPAAPAAPGTTTTVDEDGDDESALLPIGIGVGALAGAGLIAAVGVRRRLQQRQRRAHHRITVPASGPAEYEQRLRAAERPEGAEFLDLALSTVGIELADAGRRMPAFTTGHLTVAGLELRLRTAEPPIAPFNAVDGDTTRWFCPVDAPLVSADRARALPAPCPTLTPVGRTGVGEILLDLESCPVTVLDGTPEQRRQILRTLAVALLTGPRGEDVSVTAVGLDDDLGSLESLPGQRISRVASLTEALSRLAGWHDACAEVLTREYTPSARAARTIGAAPDTWPPEIVLSREPLDADAIAALRRLEAQGVRTAWTVVAPAADGVETPEHWYTLPTGPDPTALAGVEGDVTIHRLPDEELAALVGIFTAAADTKGHVPAEPHEEASSGPAPDGTTAPGEAVSPAPPTASQRGPVTVTTYIEPVSDREVTATPGAPTAVPAFPIPVGLTASTPPTKPTHQPTIGVVAPVANDDTTSGGDDIVATDEAGATEPAPESAPMDAAEAVPHDADRGTESAVETTAKEPGQPAPEPEADPTPEAEPRTDTESDEEADIPEANADVDPGHAAPSVPPVPSVAPFRSFLGSGEPETGDDGGSVDAAPATSPTPSDHADVTAWLDSLPTPDDEDAAWAQAWEETMAATSSTILPATNTPTATDSAAPAESTSPMPATASTSTRTDGESTLTGVPTARHPGPEIRVLGPVEIVGVGDPAEASKRARLTELAAFLVLNPGLGHNDVDAAIWPDSASATNRHTAMSKLRRWLGHDPHGDPYLPMIGDGGYRFAPGVTCDWTRFQRLARKGMRLGPLGGPDLTTALSMVRGRPFGGTSPRRYIWAEYLRQDMTSSIVDVAARLGELRLRDGDVRGAKLALGKGLEVCPESEMLYRLMFRTAYLSGDIAELEAYAARLNRLLDDLGCDMEDDTIHLLRSLLDARRKAPNSRAAG
ncbi:LysM peptidoglycan-binding domain-containing protein [Embleya sp. NPDC056575]|uniref:LysM peptidoglycan-binding domain-containing protein n=1 Tax=unclassified Embleya TaxID=2699296 RepID=UPI0036CDA168